MRQWSEALNSSRNTFRNRSAGSNLVMLCTMAVLIIVMMGISIYTGLQALVQQEIQKAASTAAMAGAAAYYSGNAGGKPTADAKGAIDVATNTFNAIVANSGALKGLGAKLTGVTNNDKNDSITVKAQGSFTTGFLAPVGIKRIDLVGNGTARSLKYAAAGNDSPVGPISLLPDGTMKSMQQTLELAFPLVDNPGTDLYVEQIQQIQYVVEACNDQFCYDLVSGAKKVGSGKIRPSGTLDGTDVIMGSCTIDLAKAGVRKASKLRFTHGNVFATSYGGGPESLQTYPTPAMLSEVYIYGYASACPDENNCPVPAGFVPVQ